MVGQPHLLKIPYKEADCMPGTKQCIHESGAMHVKEGCLQWLPALLPVKLINEVAEILMLIFQLINCCIVKT